MATIEWRSATGEYTRRQRERYLLLPWRKQHEARKATPVSMMHPTGYEARDGYDTAANLTLDAWTDGALVGTGTYAWYCFDAEAERSYRIRWQGGMGRKAGTTYNAYTEVSAFTNEIEVGTLSYFDYNRNAYGTARLKDVQQGYSEYINPVFGIRQIPVKTDGKVYIRVFGWTGTFSMLVTKRPPRALEGEGILKILPDSTGWGLLERTPGSTYGVTWRKQDDASILVEYYDVTVYSPDGSGMYFGPVSQVGFPQYFTNHADGKPVIKISPLYDDQHGSVKIGMVAR